MSFKIDTSEVKVLTGFASGMEEAIARAEYRAVNKVADKASTFSKREISTMVNLSSGYVKARMFLVKAQMRKPTAVITGRTRPTRLATYGARQVTAASPKSKGSSKLGIPAGRKAAGISVGVTRQGGRKVMSGAFFMKLKNDNGFGVFTRSGDGLKHRYGPSVDQVFMTMIDRTTLKENVSADLEDTLAKQLEYELRDIK